jgi:hypothetical protein
MKIRNIGITVAEISESLTTGSMADVTAVENNNNYKSYSTLMQLKQN